MSFAEVLCDVQVGASVVVKKDARISKESDS